MKDDIAIVIPSCDKYSDVWAPLFFTISKYWPDCDFKIYLVTNFLKPEIKNVHVLDIGPDISWSSNLKKAIGYVPEEKILLWVDDLFLYKKVANHRVREIINKSFSSGANYICLNGSPKPNKKVNNLWGEISPRSLYRVSTVFSCWEKGVLKDLLRDDESAWQFEIDGSARSDIYDGFFVTNKKEIFSYNSVIKGKWRRGVVVLLKKDGFFLDNSNRKIFTFIEELFFFFKKIRSKVLGYMPYKIRRGIRRFFLK